MSVKKYFMEIFIEKFKLLLINKQLLELNSKLMLLDTLLLILKFSGITRWKLLLLSFSLCINNLFPV